MSGVDAFDQLRPHFTVEETRTGNGIAIRCKHCTAGWAYPKTAELSPAAMLTLLNHAASHHGGRR